MEMKVQHGFDGSETNASFPKTTTMVRGTPVERFEADRNENDGGKREKYGNGAFELFKRNLYEFLDSSTAHGFPKVANAANWLSRILWLVVILCLISYLSISVYKLHLKITSYEINVIVKSKKVNALALPSVTVCDGQPQIKKDHSNNNATSKPAKLHEAEKQHLQNMLKQGNIDNRTKTNFILKDSKGNMPLCQFSGDQCTFKEHFVSTFPVLHKGQCYTFNHRGKLKQILRGPAMGIFAAFFLSKDANFSKSTGSTSTNGIEIFVHKKGDRIPAGTNGILAIPGHMTRISLTQKIYKRLPYPYPDQCIGNDDLNGSIHECQVKCIARHQISRCGVISITIKYYFLDMDTDALRNVSSMPIPTTDREHKCIENVVAMYANDDLLCDCNLPCYQKNYDTHVSQSKWPSANKVSEMLALVESEFGIKIDENGHQDQLAAIEVFYSQLQYDEIRQVSAYSLDNFLSDLGGILGLFIGASVFSAIDFMLFLLFNINMQLRFLFIKFGPPWLQKQIT